MDFNKSVLRGMDDVFCLILITWDVPSRNQPVGGMFKGKNKIAAKYLKVKYDFSGHETWNECNTSFSSDFDWAIHLFYYFYD